MSYKRKEHLERMELMVKKIVKDSLFLAQKSMDATEEGCLSLDGVRPCTRYQEIEVDYLAGLHQK